MNRDRVRRTLCTEKTPEENRTSQRNSTKLRSPRAPRSRIATSKHGDVPTVNALVDIGNLVSIRHALPVAVFDLANVAAPVTVSFAAGDEPFTDLGSTEAVHPDPGEVVFIDGNGEVCARRWCWRQSAGSATGPDTSDALSSSRATTRRPARTSNRRSPTSPRCSPRTSPRAGPSRGCYRLRTPAPERARASRTRAGKERTSPIPLAHGSPPASRHPSVTRSSCTIPYQRSHSSPGPHVCH